MFCTEFAQVPGRRNFQRPEGFLGYRHSDVADPKAPEMRKEIRLRLRPPSTEYPPC
jgi:hypothetical protein